MNDREQRGLMIAATAKIQQKGRVWLVPSQTNAATKYTVCPDAESPHCTCPDHETRGCKCKHLYAVEFFIRREENEDGSVTETVALTQTIKRTTYPQNWPAYNRAQTNEKAKFQVLLHDLCKGIHEPKQAGRGRPGMPMPESVFAAVFKVYSTVSGRRFISDLRDAHEKGHIRCVPSYNLIFKVLEKESTTEILRSLILASAAPLKAVESNFACDSSGFSGCRFDRWFDHKWGQQRCQRSWVKAHIMCGVKTNVITAVEIHDQNAADSPLLKPMLATTAARFNIEELSADMGYLSESNFAAITAVGAKAFIPFKSNSVATREGIWNTMFHFFHLHRDQFLARYHQRSNVESTFSMVKAKFGDGVRSKTDVAMKNEVLCKLLAHNICCLISATYELGLNPVLWAESPLAHECGQN